MFKINAHQNRVMENNDECIYCSFFIFNTDSTVILHSGIFINQLGSQSLGWLVARLHHQVIKIVNAPYW
jgi:hypothetical protein